MSRQYPGSKSWARRGLETVTTPILTNRQSLERNGQSVVYRTQTPLSARASPTFSPPQSRVLLPRSMPFVRLKRTSERIENFIEAEPPSVADASSTLQAHPTSRFSRDGHGGEEDKGLVAKEVSPSPPRISGVQYDHHREGTPTLRVINKTPKTSPEISQSPPRNHTPRPAAAIDYTVDHLQLPPNPFRASDLRSHLLSSTPYRFLESPARPRAVKPIRPKRKGPAVCPFNRNFQQSPLQRSGALRYSAVYPVTSGRGDRRWRTLSCRGAQQMVSESIHESGLEKHLPHLPSILVAETDEHDKATDNSVPGSVDIPDALAFSVATQGIFLTPSFSGSQHLIAHPSPHRISSPVELPTGAPYEMTREEKLDDILSRLQNAVSAIGFPPLSQDRDDHISEALDDDIWLDIAQEEMQRTRSTMIIGVGR